MPHFFEKRDRWGHGLGLWVLVGMAFILPVAAWGVSQLRIDQDVGQWLPHDNLQLRQSAWYQQHFQSADSVLITWEESALEDPRVEQFAQRLLGTADPEGIRRGGLRQVAAVQTPGQLLQRMIEAKVDRAEALQRLTGVLVGSGPVWCQFTTAGLNQRERSLRMLKEQAARRFGLELHIVERFGARAEQLAAEAEAQAEADGTETDPAASTASEAAIAATVPVEEIAAHDFQVSWESMHSSPKVIADFITWARDLRLPVVGQNEGEPLLSACFVHAGQPAAIAITLSEAGKADLPGTLELIRETGEQIGISRSALHLCGSPVIATQLNDEIWRTVWNPAAPWYLPQQRSLLLFACAMGLFLCCWTLRSVRLGLIVCGVSAWATLSTLSLIPLWGRPLNTALIVMTPILLSLFVSAAIHVVHRWKGQAGRDTRSAIIQAMLGARIPCGLAAVGLAVSLASFLTSQLIPLRMFGFVAVAGSVLCLIGTLYGLPALLQACQIRPAGVTGSRRFWTVIGRLVVRYSTAITAASVVISSATLYGLTKFQTEPRSIANLPQASRVLHDYSFAEGDLAGTLPLETVISFSKEAREELSFTQRMEIVRSVEQKLRQLPEITGALSLADFQPVHEPLRDEATLREKVAFKNQAKAVEASVRKEAHSRELYLIAKGATEFNDAGDELWRITGRVAISSRLDYQNLIAQVDANCRSVIKYHADTRHTVTGPVPVLYATQQAIFDAVFYAAILGCAGTALVMMVVTRDVWAGLLSMPAIVLPAAAVLGLHIWKGIPVDVTTLIVACVGLGIASTRAVHLLTCYRECLIAGISRRRAIVRTLEQSGPVLGEATVVIGFPLLALCFSPLLLIGRLGTMTSALVLTTMISSVMLTPAMLAGPLGWLMYYAVQKQRNRLKAITEDPDLDEIDRHGPHIMPPKPQIVAGSRPDGARQFDQRESRQRKRRR